MEEVKRDQNGKWLPGMSANPATQLTGSVKKYPTPELLQEHINNYFEIMEQEERAPTFTGLAIHLGFVNRKSLLDYRKKEGYEAFHPIVEAAKLRLEAYLEENLVSAKGSTIGILFNLKVNFQWKDTQEITHKLEDKKIEGFNYLPPAE